MAEMNLTVVISGIFFMVLVITYLLCKLRWVIDEKNFLENQIEGLRWKNNRMENFILNGAQKKKKIKRR